MNRASLSPQKKVVPSSAKPRHTTKASKTSTSSTTSKVTILPITPDLRLAADTHTWMIQKRKQRKHRQTGQPINTWQAISWHPTLEQAVNVLADYQLRVSGTQGVEQALAEVKRIAATLTRSLSPRFDVKKKVA